MQQTVLCEISIPELMIPERIVSIALKADNLLCILSLK